MRRVLATIAIGEHVAVHDITGPRMEEYARQIDAEYLVIRETERKPPHYAKFDLLSRVVAEGFDKLLYVDADIYIRKQAPNIFDHYHSAAFSEIPHPRPDWVSKPVIWIRDNLVPDWPADRYFNTGVMVIESEELKSLAAITANATPVPGIFYEQDQLNTLMRDVNFPQQRLDQRWNQFCGRAWITPAKADAAYFLHCTGEYGEHRVRVVKKYAREYP